MSDTRFVLQCTKCTRSYSTPSVHSPTIRPVYTVLQYAQCTRSYNTPSVHGPTIRPVYTVLQYAQCTRSYSTPSVHSPTVHPVYTVLQYPLRTMCTVHRYILISQVKTSSLYKYFYVLNRTRSHVQN